MDGFWTALLVVLGVILVLLVATLPCWLLLSWFSKKELLEQYEFIQRVDGIAFATSLLACITSVVFWARSDSAVYFDTWQDSKIWRQTNASDTQLSHGTVTNAINMALACVNASHNRSLQVSQREWQDVKYEHFVVGIELSTHAFVTNQWLLVVFILSAASFMQGRRFQRSDTEKSAQAWEARFTTKGDGDGSDSDLYNPDLPDFGRWFEYAWTSPFQVVLVVGTVGLGETRFVLVAATLQCALVLHGYHIELLLWHWQYGHKAQTGTPQVQSNTFAPGERSRVVPTFNVNAMQFKYGKRGETASYEALHVVDSRAKQRQTKRPDVGVSAWTILRALFFVWVVHFSLWVVVVQHFYQEINTFNDCNFDVKAPAWIQALVWSQCLLFSAFGGVQTWQFVSLLVTKEGERDTWESSSRWRQVSLLYSILSVTAKTLLDVFFIWGSAM